ncbi:hypothetical protein Ahy_A06g030010 isoform B [Arachis hypogaea]|uniref:Uncharacterized protein n=1 Tax=Arachis hypogaea TaxID=3818 RepID=A0A445CUX2_ARAHY|nr:hypothetical protein Ahy_A06g030010 isoform B [Arachis hypogaea]
MNVPSVVTHMAVHLLVSKHEQDFLNAGNNEPPHKPSLSHMKSTLNKQQNRNAKVQPQEL